VKHPPCIFCDHESGSPEHLWPDWMHNLVKFAPINMQEADGPILFGQDPEQTIDTVCGDCNHGWMSQIEQKNVSRLKPMLLNTPITLDPGGMKILTEWAVLRAMVAESIKPRNNNENFYERQERVAFKHSLAIPARTRVWVGALINSNPDEYHIGCHGTDYTIMIDGGKTRIGTGSVSTIYAGNFVFQTATEHLTPPYVCEQQALITPPPGPADERLMEIYPKRPKPLDWPPEPFTESGPTGVILGLFGRWHMGEKVSKIKNA
jgi:hypothetical protein